MSAGLTQSKSVYFVGSRKVHSAASDDAGVPLARSIHQLVRATTAVNDCTRVAIESAQALVTVSRVYCPHNYVIGGICRCHPGRALTALACVPRGNYRGRIGGRNSVSG